MVKKSGSTRLKRQMAPKFWDIKRKDSPFVLGPRPGPYSKTKCYPIGVVIRDVLRLCSNLMVPTQTTEKSLKLLKITSKVSYRGNKIQYGFHDGKTLISDNKDMKVGDSCLVTIPEINIEQHIKFETGCNI